MIDVPLWLALVAVVLLGIRLVRPPIWLVAALLLTGYLSADTFIGTALRSVLD
ncbi:hypothetical protein [Streptomyces sp. NPDC005012]|uniref:hypothetical protein n=1 Tax=Streptomyces sp. NPDC005012 TaxID=3154558 RepID=UPI0033A46055